MATIHLYTVTVFAGRMKHGHRRGAILEPAAGVNGNALVRAGWRADICRVPTSVFVATEAIAFALMEAYRSLEWRQVTVIDQFARSWLGTTVVSVDAEHSLTPLGTYRVDAVWEFLPKTVPAV